MKKYDFHPIADTFPLIEGDEKKELFADIDKNGVHEQGVLYEDKILDGRNRYLACKAAGVEMPFRKFDPQIDGDSPFEFVVSMNLRRRHMTASQRAMVAAKLANLSEGRPPNSGETESNDSVSLEQAAKAMNVARPTAQRAKKVQQKAPSVVHQAVETGKVTVADAASVADLPKPEQKAALKKVEAGKSRTMKAAADQIEKRHKAGAIKGNPKAFAGVIAEIGKTARMVERLNEQCPAAKFHRDARNFLNDALTTVRQWQQAVR